MNIAQALKEKNRVAGQVAKLQQRLIQCNTRVKGVEPEFKADEILNELTIARNKLIDLRIRIQRANHGIVDKLVRLSEDKADLAFWQEFANIYTGPAERTVMTSVFDNGERNDVPEVHIHDIDTRAAIGRVDELQERINKHQDEIDAYNASTQV